MQTMNTNVYKHTYTYNIFIYICMCGWFLKIRLMIKLQDAPAIEIRNKKNKKKLLIESDER